MNMDEPVDQNRLTQLDLDGFVEGRYIVFCEKCNFQYPPDTIGPSFCPEGHGRLRDIRLGPELKAMNHRRRPSYTGSGGQ